MTSIKVRVFALFSLGYFVSFLFRGVNLGFSPFLVHDLGLSTTDLGTLTSLYFLGFAAAQIPGGVLLDHFGARRVIALVMLIAAIGIYLFGNAHSLAAMMAGRLLIGVGVSVCLGGAFKATAQHFPLNQLTLINGLVMAVGGMGASSSGRRCRGCCRSPTGAPCATVSPSSPWSSRGPSGCLRRPRQ